MGRRETLISRKTLVPQAVAMNMNTNMNTNVYMHVPRFNALHANTLSVEWR